MRLLQNTLKSTLLATGIFWLLYIKHVNISDVLFFVFISFLPIFLTCLLTIAITIYPFYVYGDINKISRKSIFKLYFPYYAMLFFCFAVFILMSTHIDSLRLIFFTSAFITTCQSWVWFAKQ